MEALENLKKIGYVWKEEINNLMDEKNYSFLKNRRDKKNLGNKPRIFIFPRPKYEWDGFAYAKEGKLMEPRHNHIIYRVAGYDQEGNFMLSNSVDDFHGVAKALVGKRVLELLDKDYAKLEEMANEIAEKYRGKQFGKDFLDEILNGTNNIIGSLRG